MKKQDTKSLLIWDNESYECRDTHKCFAKKDGLCGVMAQTYHKYDENQMMIGTKKVRYDNGECPFRKVTI